jgi:hypothetical protein
MTINTMIGISSIRILHLNSVGQIYKAAVVLAIPVSEFIRLRILN